MLGFGIRQAVKREMSRILGRSAESTDCDAPVPAAHAQDAPPPQPEAPAPIQAVATATEEVAAATAPEGEISPEAVQAILDEMIRPALQADGGDIALVGVFGNDIHVRLVGACSACPSSIMTMKMGVERLLHEEFPTMGELVQVDSAM
jgi:Fe-S cluster biogenesis protein NfuA